MEETEKEFIGVSIDLNNKIHKLKGRVKLENGFTEILKEYF